jgi:holo-[acyl-carrier protein] synthase
MQVRQSYVGVDLVEIDRVRHAVSRWGERFLRRVFTENEITCYRDRPPSLAVRFAAKEAVWKALGPPAGYFSWREVEVLNDATGRPCVSLSGNALAQARALGVASVEISLSHSRSDAIAVVVATRQ